MKYIYSLVLLDSNYDGLEELLTLYKIEAERLHVHGLIAFKIKIRATEAQFEVFKNLLLNKLPNIMVDSFHKQAVKPLIPLKSII